MKYKELFEYTTPPNLPPSPTTLEELGGKDILVEMVNLLPSRTGINGVLFVSSRMGQHGPRVKYYVKPGDDQPSYCISISTEPKIVASSIPAHVSNKTFPSVSFWVKENHVALLELWNSNGTWMEDKVDQFKDGLIPYRGKKGKKNE